MRSLLLTLWILFALVACSASDELIYSEPQMARIPAHTQLLELIPTEVPGDVTFTGVEAVLFLVNRASRRQLSVVIHDRTDTIDCPRTVGFECSVTHRRTVSAHTVPPGGLASVCFHRGGRYRYEVWYDGERLGEGLIIVRGGS